MAKSYFTTTEAAKVLSVSADTVLKWVRAGKIQSYRTPGGHSRIPKEAVAKMLPGDLKTPEESVEDLDPYKKTIYKYCWDFYAKGGVIKEDCRHCVAFRTRAQRCYEMRDLPKEFGLLQLHCKTGCDECDYYMLKKDQEVNALILIRDRKILNLLLKEARQSHFIIKFALSEYECASMIEKIRPDYIVIDCSIGLMRTQNLCQNLIQDERIPNVRIILSSKKATAKEYCDNEAFGWITKPFSIRQLEDLIQGTMN